MLSKYFGSTEEKTDFAIALVVIALAGILIGYYSFFDQTDLFSQSKEDLAVEFQLDTLDLDGHTFIAVVPPSEKIPPINQHSGSQDDAVIETPYRRVDSLAENQTKVAMDSNRVDDGLVGDDTDKNELDGSDLKDTDDVGMEDSTTDLLDSIINEPNESVKDTESNYSTDVDTSVKESIKQSDTEETAVKPTSKPQPKKRKSKIRRERRTKCIVIVGAYNNKSNIKKLVGRLDADGYPVFKVPYKGLTRVGAYVDCQNSASILTKIQAKYTPDAFLMKTKY
ncbi:MAG TPA: hypothetical protein ENK85_08675 [Saprospiraceae bacterium]|nr:hypothetical protein [Saprospiraceae bacterium]